MSKIFIDSNICIYVFDNANENKRQIAFDFLGQCPCISSQVIIETYNACSKKLKGFRKKYVKKILCFCVT